jgi:hypothetical protein
MKRRKNPNKINQIKQIKNNKSKIKKEIKCISSKDRSRTPENKHVKIEIFFPSIILNNLFIL